VSRRMSGHGGRDPRPGSFLMQLARDTESPLPCVSCQRGFLVGLTVVGLTVVGLSGYTLKTALARFIQDWDDGSPDLPVSYLPPLRRLARRLSSEQLDGLAAEYDDAATAAELAAVVGVAKSALLKLFRERGVRIRTRRSLTEAEIDDAVRLYAGGLLLREIGERLVVSRDCVRLALKRRGVVLRPGLGARLSGRREPRS
jgi:hypothetical protein